MYTCTCISQLFVNCFLLFEASWKIDVLSNEWPLEIKSLLLVVVSFDTACRGRDGWSSKG